MSPVYSLFCSQLRELIAEGGVDEELLTVRHFHMLLMGVETGEDVSK